MSERMVRCPACDGDGTMYDRSYGRIGCDKCGGSGRVPELPPRRPLPASAQLPSRRWDDVGVMDLAPDGRRYTVTAHRARGAVDPTVFMRGVGAMTPARARSLADSDTELLGMGLPGLRFDQALCTAYAQALRQAAEYAEGE